MKNRHFFTLLYFTRLCWKYEFKKKKFQLHVWGVKLPNFGVVWEQPYFFFMQLGDMFGLLMRYSKHFHFFCPVLAGAKKHENGENLQFLACFSVLISEKISKRHIWYNCFHETFQSRRVFECWSESVCMTTYKGVKVII